ncbi:cytochrome c biogenesis protein ResB [Lyngbya confervoides]|uniref:Cytochrome c biogenesis protein ResB n=1 Tax=Lyngbya confervoides BDU141951 TaxID=1574623 RepID=A0ABD4T2D7_9CYAN|nr:cytochrome c biogenesis protein ResB [Lyngbya confervoides]MCM1982605.1 cytochrome c biogenesis protein ResB [Lyngbya confervoides BDU141951]
MTSKLVRFLGSVQLAVPLLGAIAVILISATVLESAVGSAIVQRWVYRSPWFGGLIFLLAVNLGLSTGSRYPWRGARKIGFALTHTGLIILIAGSAAVIHLSTEGMLLLRTDGPARQEIRVEGDRLEVVGPDLRSQQADIFLRSKGTVFPQRVGSLNLLGYSPDSRQAVSFRPGGSVDNLAVHLQLHSDRLGQTLDPWLAVAPLGYEQMDLGPAHLELRQAENEAQLQQLTQAPISGGLGLLELGADAQPFKIEDLLHPGVQLSSGVQVQVRQVWPDFRLDAQGTPTTASPQFLNPAVQVHLTQNSLQEDWYVFGRSDFAPIRSGHEIQLAMTYRPPTAPASDFFRIIATPDQQLYYAANSSHGFTTGPLPPGQVVAPGWADFQISVLETLDRSQIQRAVLPVFPGAEATPLTVPAIHFSLPTGQDYWAQWGEPLKLESSEGPYFLYFGPKLLDLPFSVQLDHFIVERNEGSDSVAMWTSEVTLRESVSAPPHPRRIWMNHPTWFKGWKLAQASWNPGDLSQSTLQVKREPGWVTALTWLGSILVVVGIGTLFYGRAIAKGIGAAPAEPIAPDPESEPQPAPDATPA